MTAHLRKRLALAMGSLFLVLVLAEVVARATAPPAPCLRFEQDVQELRDYELHDAITMVENDPELFWRLVPDRATTTNTWPFFGLLSNAQGLREDHEIPLKKQPGELRILFLGDSCTFGYGVTHDQAFVDVAENSLRAKHPDALIECINAGVPGYSLFQGWRYLETEGLKYKPDIVVLNFGWNDFSIWDNRSDEDHYDAMKASRPPGMLAGSRLLQLAWKKRTTNGHEWTQRYGEAGDDARVRVSPSEFGLLLRKVKHLTAKNDIDLLVIAWPGRGNTSPKTRTDFRTRMQAEMILFGKKHPMPGGASSTLDLVPLAQQLVKEHGEKAVYFDKCHVLPLGHAAIARATAEKIAPWVSGRLGSGTGGNSGR